MSNVDTVLVNHPGPLPISFKYTPKSDVVETIFLSGSMFTGNLACVNVGFRLLVDGKEAGRSLIYTSEIAQNSHNATVPIMVNYDIPFVIPDPKHPVAQPVTMTLESLDPNEYFSDKNDFFNVTIFW